MDLAAFMLWSQKLEPVLVPSLRQKLDLLCTYGRHRTWEELAGQFGLKEKTLRWWANGDAARRPGSVPAKHVDRLISLFQEALPGGNSADETRKLIFGPVSELEDIFRTGATMLLSEIIAREGRTDTCRLLRARKWNPGLVEHDDPARPRSQYPLIELDERFSLEFSLDGKAGHALVLQNIQQVWAVVLAGNGRASTPVSGGSFIFPGKNTKGEEVRLYEARDIGVHRFICFISPMPFPSPVIEAAQGGMLLDKSLLDNLARFYTSLEKQNRAIHILTVEVVSLKNS